MTFRTDISKLNIDTFFISGLIFRFDSGTLDRDKLGPAIIWPVLVKGTVGGTTKRWDFKARPELPNSQLDELYWSSPHKQIFEDFRAKVVKVHDGDTVTLRCDFRDFDFPLRLLDIDTPELNARDGHKVRDWLADKIEGQDVDIMMNRKQRTEKWGRLLGKIMFKGIDMGETMMRLGMAIPFEQRLEEEIPNINKMLSIEKWL